MLQQNKHRLTGDQLLQEIDRLADSTCEEKAQQCGYVAIASNGIEAVDLIEFMAAVLEARDVPVGPSIMDSLPLERHHLIKVQADGCIEISAHYLLGSELEDCDEVHVTVDKQRLYLSSAKSDSIHA